MDDSQLNKYKETQLKALDFELKAQSAQVKTAFQSLTELKKTGYGIHPISVTNQTYGFADYPEITFKVPLNQSIERFKQSDYVELFSDDGVVKGSLIYLNVSEGKIRIFEDDFPDWIDNKAIGIRTGVDEKSMRIAKETIEKLNESNPYVNLFFNDKKLAPNKFNFSFNPSKNLNDSQNNAVKQIVGSERISIVHGPPGTGKTTTLVEAIKQITQQGEKVVAVAPSNMALDHLTSSLIKAGIHVLRLGNPSKISTELTQHTLEGKLSEGATFQELKKLKIQAEEYRKMASQYKRNFGKEEREQRKLIWSHYRELKKEILKTIDFYKDKWQEQAQVICGTPISLAEEIKNEKHKIVVIDEAGQCLQSFGWVVIQPHIEKIILAGDHLQLPPTVISEEAIRLGMGESILDLFISKFDTHFLDTQYRMRSQIVGFSNAYFYEGKLQTDEKRANQNTHLYFYDTAGTGYEESRSQEGSSYFNEDELNLASKVIENLNLDPKNIAFISPYSGQVSKAKELNISASVISSIDSFQGQEYDTIILSLVRSNDKNEIGFLKDYRRMNVAMTRAKEQLIVIGDSSTLGNDAFYKQFLDYIEQENAYHTAWEILY
jgi:superfamily I DNA and/or RNA helicase